MKGIESVSSDEKEKKLTVTGDVDADEVQLVVEKLRKRGPNLSTQMCYSHFAYCNTIS